MSDWSLLKKMQVAPRTPPASFMWIDVSQGPESKAVYKKKRLHITNDRFRKARKRRGEEGNGKSKSRKSSDRELLVDDDSGFRDQDREQTTVSDHSTSGTVSELLLNGREVDISLGAIPVATTKTELSTGRTSSPSEDESEILLELIRHNKINDSKRRSERSERIQGGAHDMFPFQVVHSMLEPFLATNAYQSHSGFSRYVEEGSKFFYSYAVRCAFTSISRS